MFFSFLREKKLTSLYGTFQCERYGVFKKKTPSKVAHNWPRILFFSTGPAAQTAQKQKSRNTKSPLNAGLGIQTGVLHYVVPNLLSFRILACKIDGSGIAQEFFKYQDYHRRRLIICFSRIMLGSFFCQDFLTELYLSCVCCLKNRLTFQLAFLVIK